MVTVKFPAPGTECMEKEELLFQGQNVKSSNGFVELMVRLIHPDGNVLLSESCPTPTPQEFARAVLVRKHSEKKVRETC